MKTKTKTLIVLSVAWMALIFFLSGQSSKDSTNTSDNVTAVIVDTMYGEEKPKSNKDVGVEESDTMAQYLIDKGVVPKDDLFGRNKFDFKNDVRKLAHIGLYMVLAVMVNAAFISHFGRNGKLYAAISFGICAVYACLDELHQRFVPGRAGRWSDVGIDCIGALIGILLTLLVCLAVKLVKILLRNRKTTV